MVARTPQKQAKMVAPLNPILLRETIKKMERCMDRLQELQCTVTGGERLISRVSHSPHGTRGSFSIRSKQDPLRINKNAAPKKSPVGKFPATRAVEWRRMSLPAMLLGETVGEILQASQFAREIVASIKSTTMKTAPEDPRTPITESKNPRGRLEDSELKTRRKREKQNRLQLIRSETNSPSLQRARSRINFKISPPRTKECNKDTAKYLANRVSPRNRPWAKKTVLFPNPLFLASTSSQQQKFNKTKSPVIARKTDTPHKFLIKSPQTSGSKFQVKIKNAPLVSISPTRPTGKKSPKAVSTASKLRRSFSPSRLATRLVSPLKGMRSVQKKDGRVISGLKQRPNSTPMRFSMARI